MKPCLSCWMLVTRRWDKPGDLGRCEKRMSLASVTGSLTTSGSTVTTGGPTAHTARPPRSPVQHKSRQSLGNVGIPMHEERATVCRYSSTVIHITSNLRILLIQQG